MNAKNMNGGYEEFNNFWKNWLDGTKFLKKVFNPKYVHIKRINLSIIILC